MGRRRGSGGGEAIVGLVGAAIVATAFVVVVTAKVTVRVCRWAHQKFAEHWSELDPADQRRAAEALLLGTLGFFGAVVLLAMRLSMVTEAHARAEIDAAGRARAQQVATQRCAETESAASKKAASMATRLAALEYDHDLAERRAANVRGFAAMSVDARLKEASRVCPAQGTCDEETLSGLVDSAKGLPDLPSVASGVARLVARHEEALRVARRREAARQAEAEAAEKRRAALEHEASRGIRCCDGQQSPTCLCHASSHQGCCSWHGGVCGCEP